MPGILHRCLRPQVCPLVCHQPSSLGGGISTILAHLIKSDLQFNRYPRIRVPVAVQCFAYSPPGCVISREGKAYFKEFCTSIVVGMDLIPRLSRKSARNLIENIQEIVRTCNHAKIHILAGLVGRLFYQRSRWMRRLVPHFLVPKWFRIATEQEYVDLPESGEGRSSSSRDLLELERHAMNDVTLTDDFAATPAAAGSEASNPEGEVDMFLAGRVLYFMESVPMDLDSVLIDTGDGHADHSSATALRGRESGYVPVWADATDHQFQEIRVHGEMFGAHIPSHTRNLFDKFEG